MVTFWDFISIRSTRSLVRRSRRDLVKIFNSVSNVIPDLSNKLKKQIEFANEKKTEEVMNKILDEYEIVSEKVHNIVKNEFLVIYRMQQREYKNETDLYKTVKNSYTKLNSQDQNLLRECNNIFIKTREQIDSLINKVRSQERDLLFDRTKLFKYLSVHSTEASLEASKRYFITERQLSSQEKSKEKEISKLIKSIESLLKQIKEPKDLAKNEKKISSLIKDLHSQLNKLLPIVRDEAAVMMKIFRRLTVFRMKFRFDLTGDKQISSKENGSIYNMLIYLESEEFNKNKLNSLKNRVNKILNQIRDNYYEEEKMIKHEKRESNRQRDRKISAGSQEEEYKKAA